MGLLDIFGISPMPSSVSYSKPTPLGDKQTKVNGYQSIVDAQKKQAEEAQKKIDEYNRAQQQQADKLKTFGWKAVFKNVLKGPVRFGADLVGYDMKAKHWDWKKCATNVAITGVLVGADILSGGALTVPLLALGIGMSGIQTAKGISKVSNAKTYEEKEEAWEEIGEGATSLAVSAFGIRGLRGAKAKSITNIADAVAEKAQGTKLGKADEFTSIIKTMREGNFRAKKGALEDLRTLTKGLDEFRDINMSLKRPAIFGGAKKVNLTTETQGQIVKTSLNLKDTELQSSASALVERIKGATDNKESMEALKALQKLLPQIREDEQMSKVDYNKLAMLVGKAQREIKEAGSIRVKTLDALSNLRHPIDTVRESAINLKPRASYAYGSKGKTTFGKMGTTFVVGTTPIVVHSKSSRWDVQEAEAAQLAEQEAKARQDNDSAITNRDSAKEEALDKLAAQAQEFGLDYSDIAKMSIDDKIKELTQRVDAEKTKLAKQVEAENLETKAYSELLPEALKYNVTPQDETSAKLKERIDAAKAVFEKKEAESKKLFASTNASNPFQDIFSKINPESLMMPMMPSIG